MYQIAQFKQLRLWYQQASRSEDQDKGGIARANTYFDFEHKVTDLSGPKICLFLAWLRVEYKGPLYIYGLQAFA